MPLRDEAHRRAPERSDQVGRIAATSLGTDSGEVHPSPCLRADRVTSSRPLRVSNSGLFPGGSRPVLPEHVAARQRRVAAQLHLDRRREPAEVEIAVGSRRKAVSDRFISRATACIQTRSSRPV